MNHIYMVPGYAVRATLYTPDAFGNIPLRHGALSGSGETFRGKGGTDHWFHFPITNPTILNDVRLKCDLVAVTLHLEATNAFLRNIWVFDRTDNFFQSPGMNVTGDRSNTWVMGENAISFPDREVNGAIGISVNIFFDQDSDVTFTGAGARFHD